MLKSPPAYPAGPDVLLIQKKLPAVTDSVWLNLVAKVPGRRLPFVETRAVVDPTVSTKIIRAGTVAVAGADFCTNVTDVESPTACIRD